MRIDLGAKVRTKDGHDAGSIRRVIVDPTTQHPENLIWKYHWTVSNELERRQESALKRAHEIAGQK